MKKKQFTLIELLLVIVIIAVLASMLFPRFNDFVRLGDDVKCKSNLSNIYVGITSAAQKGDLHEGQGKKVTETVQSIWPKLYDRLNISDYDEAFRLPTVAVGPCPTGSEYKTRTFYSYTLGADSLEDIYRSGDLTATALPEQQILVYPARQGEGKDDYAGLVHAYQAYNYHNRSDEGEYIGNWWNFATKKGFYNNNATMSGAIVEEDCYYLNSTLSYLGTGETHENGIVYASRFGNKRFEETQSEVLVVGGLGSGSSIQDKGPNHYGGLMTHEATYD